MKLGDKTPPAPPDPPKVADSLTQAAIAISSLNPTQRTIHLYEQIIAGQKADLDEAKAKNREWQTAMLNDRPFAVKLEGLKGKYKESLNQHVLTTIITSLGALGMGVFDRKEQLLCFGISVGVTAIGTLNGVACKPLGLAIDKWTEWRMKEGSGTRKN